VRANLVWVYGLFVAAAACSSVDQPPMATTGADSADQVIVGLTHYLTVDGIRRARLEADTAYFFQGAQTAEMLNLKVTFYSPQGAETSTLTSREGTYRWRTQDMEARIDVVAVTPDGRRLMTSRLQYDRTTDKIIGPEPYTFVTPDREGSGESFISDPDFREVTTTRARGAVGRVER